MKYMGSKSRIAKYIVPIINNYISQNNIEYYFEPFCGGMNVIDKVICKYKYASDNNIFLIELFKHIDEVERLPDEISKEHYVQVKNEYNCYKQGICDELKYPIWYMGAIGFLASYNGKFFEGGYSGTRIVKNGIIRNYYKEAKNNLLKQRDNLHGIYFDCCDYRNVNPKSSVIYCDIPYLNTTQYGTSRNFNHEDFYNWCRGKSKNNIVLLSEQEAPSDFKCIWEQENTRTLNHNNHIKRVEKLFVLE